MSMKELENEAPALFELRGVRRTLAYLQVASEMENFGYDFYIRLRDYMDNPDKRELLVKLAKDEMDHKVRIEKTAAVIRNTYVTTLPDDKKGVISHDENYLNDLRHFAFVFPKKSIDEVTEMTLEEILLMALDIEKKSVHYYSTPLKFGNIRYRPLSTLLESLSQFELDHMKVIREYLEELD